MSGESRDDKSIEDIIEISKKNWDNYKSTPRDIKNFPSTNQAHHCW